jgi:hypothetical protein
MRSPGPPSDTLYEVAYPNDGGFLFSAPTFQRHFPVKMTCLKNSINRFKSRVSIFVKSNRRFLAGLT